MKKMKNDTVLLKAYLKCIFIVDIISLNGFFSLFWISNAEMKFSDLSYKHLFVYIMFSWKEALSVSCINCFGNLNGQTHVFIGLTF